MITVEQAQAIVNAQEKVSVIRRAIMTMDRGKEAPVEFTKLIPHQQLHNISCALGTYSEINSIIWDALAEKVKQALGEAERELTEAQDPFPGATETRSLEQTFDESFVNPEK